MHVHLSAAALLTQIHWNLHQSTRKRTHVHTMISICVRMYTNTYFMRAEVFSVGLAFVQTKNQYRDKFTLLSSI